MKYTYCILDQPLSRQMNKSTGYTHQVYFVTMFQRQMNIYKVVKSYDAKNLTS